MALELFAVRAAVRKKRFLPDHGDLRRLVSMARAQTFVRTALDGPSDLLSEMVTHLVRSPQDDYTDSLLAAAQRLEARRRARPPAGAADLSQREEGVLRYLQTRLTTREIAGELYISMNTLKSHLKSINRKLGASSRSDAVTRARTRGLL